MKSKRASPQAYPPAVAAMAPDSLNGLFSNMSDAQWADFVETVKGLFEGALSEGRWRGVQGSDKGVIAMSCPRF